MSRALRGRPVLHPELSYFRAANLRNHVKIVPGWMIWQQFRHSSGLSFMPASARRRR
jgi:hypothetical protein